MKVQRQLYVDRMILTQASTPANGIQSEIVEVSSENEGEAEQTMAMVEFSSDNGGNGEETVTKLDRNALLSQLNCRICSERLSPPVYQCDEGHIACDSCCKEIQNTCPTCTKPISSRCTVIEMFSAKYSCVNKEYGCMEKLCFLKKEDHEQKQCQYVPVPCPCCDYVGESKCLYAHFARQHPSSATSITFNNTLGFNVSKEVTQVILQESGENTLFILHSFPEPRGSVFYVTCLAPSSSDDKFFYTLVAKNGNTRVTMKDFVEFTPKLVDLPLDQRKCLLVSKAFYNITSSKSCVIRAGIKIAKVI